MRKFLLITALLTLIVGASASAQTLQNGAKTFPVANDNVFGTTLNGTAKVNTSNNAINAGTGDTTVPTYICLLNCGTSGNAGLAMNGLASCTMDSTIASAAGGFYVINSTATAKQCHAQSAAPTSGTWVMGYLAASSTASGSTAMVWVDGFVFGGSAGSGGSTCTNFPSPGAYTPALGDCLASGTYTLPTSVTTLSGNSGTILCTSKAAIIARGSGASGIKLTGNQSGVKGCMTDDGAFTSTQRLFEFTGTDDFAVDIGHQNPGATSSAFPTIDFTGSATRPVASHIIFLGTQVDPCVNVNSAGASSGTITEPVMEYITVAAFGPTAATRCILVNEAAGATVSGSRETDNTVISTTAGATSFAHVCNSANIDNTSVFRHTFSRNKSYSASVGITGNFHLFCFNYGTVSDLVVDDNGHAPAEADLSLGDFYMTPVSNISIKGGGNEFGITCADCQWSPISNFSIDGIGGGDAGVQITSVGNPSSDMVVGPGTIRLSANGIGLMDKGNGSGKPSDNNTFIGIDVNGNGNANSTGMLFDIGNSSTGKNNKIVGSNFHGFNGASSVDIKINSASMTNTFIGADNTFDSADTQRISDSGTGTVIAQAAFTVTGALAAGTATVTFPGNGFNSATSYNCTVRDTTTPANAITLGTFTATTVVLSGTGTDNYSLSCY